MNNTVKVALIAGLAAIAAVAIYLYFSPYQQCVRAAQAEAKRMWGAEADPDAGKQSCAH